MARFALIFHFFLHLAEDAERSRPKSETVGGLGSHRWFGIGVCDVAAVAATGYGVTGGSTQLVADLGRLLEYKANRAAGGDRRNLPGLDPRWVELSIPHPCH